MLKHVTATLEALHLLQPGRELHYSLNITIGEAISISAFDSATHFFQIKASEFIDLTHEYAAYQRAWSAFPDFVPRPLGYATRAGWHIMISEGIFHTHFPAQLIALYEQAPQGPAADLMRFFAIGRQQILDASATSNALLLEQLESYFAATPHAQLAARWLQFARQQGVQALAQVAQHGDFVLNNLACSGNKLVIFDWEDYGKISLPGLDLSTLAMTVAGGNAATMGALANENAAIDQRLDAFLRRACALSEVDFGLFRRLIPVYLLVFLYLKRNYGLRVQQRIGALLQQLSD